MLSLLDKALERFNLWAKRILAAHTETLKTHQVLVGMLVVMPIILFPFLVMGVDIHWWHTGDRGALALLFIMTVTAVSNALFHGVIALILFLGLWRGKVALLERKQTRMKVNYLCCPVLYSLIAAWGVTALWGQTSNLLLQLNVVAFLLWWSANFVLTLSERKALSGAV